MFDEMFVMASRGLVMVFFRLFILYHCHPLLLLILSYHSILGNDMGFWSEKVA